MVTDRTPSIHMAIILRMLDGARRMNHGFRTTLSANYECGISDQGLPRYESGSLGSSRRRSPITVRRISDVPPPIVLARLRKNPYRRSSVQLSDSGAAAPD